MNLPLPRILRSWCFLLLGSGFGLGGLLPVSALEPIGEFDSSEGSAIYIEVNSLYDILPSQGYAPLEIIIENGSPHAHTWNFYFKASNKGAEMESAHFIRVGPQSEHREIFLLPLPSQLRDTPESANVSGYFRGYGVRSGRILHWGRSLASSPCILMSKSVGGTQWEDLRGEFTTGSDPIGSLVESEHFLPEWRAYMGFDVVALSESEWRGFSPGVREALTTWARGGGNLVIYTKQSLDLARLSLGRESRTHDYFGLGYVRLFAWDGKAFDVAESAKKFRHALRSHQMRLEAYRDGGAWPLFAAMPEKKFPTALLALFLFGFALVAGPVNLFFLAGRKHRARLFRTTTLLSLGAALLLFGTIIFTDGVGGRGVRYAVLWINSEDNREFLWQEQVARTGLLFGKEMANSRDQFLSPVRIADTPWSIASVSSEGDLSYAQSDAVLQGDWFVSRSLQGHVLRGVRSSRGRVERVAPADGKGVALFSHFDFSCEEIYYRDAKGKLWRAKNLRPGDRLTLEKTSTAEFERWWQENTRLGSKELRHRLKAAPRNKEFFWATSRQAGAHLCTTLPNIDWDDQLILVLGSCQDKEFSGMRSARNHETTALNSTD